MIHSVYAEWLIQADIPSSLIYRPKSLKPYQYQYRPDKYIMKGEIVLAKIGPDV